jgi:hypothetical protein
VFGWFKRRRTELQPEAKWSIAVNDDAIQVTDHAGVSKSLPRNQLAGVIIETNDSGPWGADLWWLLFGKDDQLACAFPQGASGEGPMIDYLVGLPGFDHGEMIKAMGSTENAVFPVWRQSA